MMCWVVGLRDEDDWVGHGVGVMFRLEISWHEFVMDAMIRNVEMLWCASEMLWYASEMLWYASEMLWYASEMLWYASERVRDL